jgi:hypothetical protein
MDAAELAVRALDYLWEWFDEATVRCEMGEVGRRGVLTFVLRRVARSAHVDVTRLAATEARRPAVLAERVARLADQELRG